MFACDVSLQSRADFFIASWDCELGVESDMAETDIDKSHLPGVYDGTDFMLLFSLNV